MPTFKVDENLPVEAAKLLCGEGHDSLTIGEQQMAGEPDANVAAICRQEKRVLVTLDLGFADIRAYPPSDHAGIIVLRLSRLDKAHILSFLKRLLPVLEQEPLSGKLWIVEETSVRVRG
jgi:predicted nuclease of predicted toxin-antitoxin system